MQLIGNLIIPTIHHTSISFSFISLMIVMQTKITVIAGSSCATNANLEGSKCTCNAGFFGTGLSCSSCPLGTYQTGIGMQFQSNCESCAQGTYSTAIGASGPCPPCPPGRYQNDVGSTDCWLCPAGTFQTGTGIQSQSNCTSCYGGMYAGEGAPSCTSCVAGKYTFLRGAQDESACQWCGPGTYSVPNLARSCGANGVEACATLQSSTVPGHDAWIGADGIKTDILENGLAMTEVESYPWWRVDFGVEQGINGGMIYNRGDNVSAALLNGFRIWIGVSSSYRGPGNVNCYNATTTEHLRPPYTHEFDCSGKARYLYLVSPFPAGQLQIREVEVYPQPSNLLGFNASTINQCSSCVAGTYQTGFGVLFGPSCIPCVVGTFSNVSTASEPSTCIPCEIGKSNFNDGATVCTWCSIGTYQEQALVTINFVSLLKEVCAACERGKYSTVLGASSNSTCLPCQVGTYGPNTGSSACQVCLQGTYQTGVEQFSAASCIACGVGWYSSAFAAVSNGTCTQCESGTYGPEPAMACHVYPAHISRGYKKPRVSAATRVYTLLLLQRFRTALARNVKLENLGSDLD